MSYDNKFGQEALVVSFNEGSNVLKDSSSLALSLSFAKTKVTNLAFSNL